MTVTVHVSGGRELVAEFEQAIAEIGPETKMIVKKGAQNVKTDWANVWRGIRHAPRIPRSITYDVTSDKDGSSAEIGPEDSPLNQGFLAPVFEFGGIHNAPRPGGLPALEREEPKLTQAAEDLLARLLP